MQSGDSAKEWWSTAAVIANRRYALGTAVASGLAFVAPYVLGKFVPCAEFMEVEWIMVACLCLIGVGLLNILFAFAPAFESNLPVWAARPMRRCLLVGLPVLIVAYATGLAFSPFWYALLNDPVLLCD